MAIAVSTFGEYQGKRVDQFRLVSTTGVTVRGNTIAYNTTAVITFVMLAIDRLLWELDSQTMWPVSGS